MVLSTASTHQVTPLLTSSSVCLDQVPALLEYGSFKVSEMHYRIISYWVHPAIWHRQQTAGYNYVPQQELGERYWFPFLFRWHILIKVLCNNVYTRRLLYNTCTPEGCCTCVHQEVAVQPIHARRLLYTCVPQEVAVQQVHARRLLYNMYTSGGCCTCVHQEDAGAIFGAKTAIVILEWI